MIINLAGALRMAAWQAVLCVSSYWTLMVLIRSQSCFAPIVLAGVPAGYNTPVQLPRL